MASTRSRHKWAWGSCALFAGALMALATGCPTQPSPVALTAAPPTMSVGSSEGFGSFNLSYEGDEAAEWDVQPQDSWIHVLSVTNSSNSARVSFSYDRNSRLAARTGTILVYTDVTAPGHFEITQEGGANEPFYLYVSGVMAETNNDYTTPTTVTLYSDIRGVLGTWEWAPGAGVTCTAPDTCECGPEGIVFEEGENIRISASRQFTILYVAMLSVTLYPEWGEDYSHLQWPTYWDGYWYGNWRKVWPVDENNQPTGPKIVWIDLPPTHLLQ